MTRRTPAHAAARKLEDILKWQYKPWTPFEVLSSPRLDASPGSGERGLPFPPDTPDHTGTAMMVGTPAGVEAWLEYWGAWLDFWVDDYRGGDWGAWILKQLQENTALSVAHMKPEEPGEDATPEELDVYRTDVAWTSEWCQFTKELNRLWWRIANQVGEAPLNRIPCPKCRAGWIRSTYDKGGLSDEAECTNPACGTRLDYDNSEVAASFRVQLRSITEPTYVTLTDVHTIWPGLNPATLRKWVERGYVTKKDGCYNLADINKKRREHS
nr:MAG TPA: protein of unknown function (DUF1936) [Caudoviricetes sp.]